MYSSLKTAETVVVVHEYEEDVFSHRDRVKGGALKHFVLPWVFVVLPLLILSFGGYTLVVGIRNSTQVCDQPIAELLIALGSFLVAPFILGCLFAPSLFSSGSGSNDDMIINGSITLGVTVMLAYLTTLITATIMFQSTTVCFAPLLEKAQPLLIGSWAVFGCAVLLGVSLMIKNTRSRVAAHK